MDPVSEKMIEALLNGNTSNAGLPQELTKVGDLLRVIRAPATHAELEGEQFAVQAFKAANGLALQSEGKKNMISKFLTTKAAIAAAAVALTGGGAAAATGLIPVSFNHGLPSIETVTTTSSTTSSTSTSEASTTTSPSTALASTTSTLIAGENQGMASGHSLFGLCTAYANITATHGNPSSATSSTLASSSNSNELSSTSTTLGNATASTAFTQLQALAVAENTTVAALCATVSNAGASHSQAGVAQTASSQGIMNRSSSANSHSMGAVPTSTTSTNDTTNPTTVSTTSAPSSSVSGSHGSSGSAMGHRPNG